MPARRLLLGALFSLALAAPAHADQLTFGSDLAAPATLTHADGNDWAAWNTSLPAGNAVQSPAQGELNGVRLKGFMQQEGPKSPPDFEVRVAVLRPQDDGSVSMVTNAVSLPLPLPLTQDPDTINSYDRSDLDKADDASGKGGGRICVQKGDFIALAPNGGFGGPAPNTYYANGAVMQVFGVNREASSSVFDLGHGGFDATPFPTRPNRGTELLMQTTVGTGIDARYTCRTDAEKAQNLDVPKTAPTGPAGTTPVPTGSGTPAAGLAKLTAPKSAPKVRGKKVKLPLSCTGGAACTGSLSLRNYSATKAFSIPAGQTASITLTLNRAATKKLKRKGAKLTVKALVKSTGYTTQSLRFLIKRV